MEDSYLDNNPDIICEESHWLFSLTLKAPNKNCSRQQFNFLLLSFEEIRLDVSSESSA